MAMADLKDKISNMVMCEKNPRHQVVNKVPICTYCKPSVFFLHCMIL